MKFKAIGSATVKATKTAAEATASATKVSGKAIAKGTIVVTDYTELGVQKGVVTPLRVAGRGVRVFAAKHNAARQDRQILRNLTREQKAHEKAMAKANETVVDNNDVATA